MIGKSWRRALNFAIGFGLAILLLWLFLKDADWASLGHAIGAVSVPLLALGLAGHVTSLLIRTERWRLLLSPIKPDLSYRTTWKFFNVGFAATSLLPGRIGEVLRPYLLARDQGIGFTASFATVVTERVIDLVAVLAMLGTIFIFPDTLGPHAGDPDVALLIGTIKAFGLAALVAAVAATTFLVMLRRRTEWALAVLRFFCAPLPAKVYHFLERLVRAFAGGVGGLRGWWQIGFLVGSTVVNWTIIAFCHWIMLGAFGIWVPFHHCFFLLAVVALGVVVPTPAGTGTYHIAVNIVAFNLWGFAENTVKAYALIGHLITFSPVVIVGIYYLLRGGINIFAAAEKAAEEKNAEASPD